jgi:mucin-2
MKRYLVGAMIAAGVLVGLVIPLEVHTHTQAQTVALATPARHPTTTTTLFCHRPDAVPAHPTTTLPCGGRPVLPAPTTTTLSPTPTPTAPAATTTTTTTVNPFPNNGPTTPSISGTVTYVTADGHCARTSAEYARANDLQVVPASECNPTTLLYEGRALPAPPAGVWVVAYGTCWYTSPANAAAKHLQVVPACPGSVYGAPSVTVAPRTPDPTPAPYCPTATPTNPCPKA